MTTEEAAQEIIKQAQALGETVIIAIDGRCCAGKSTLAAEIAARTGAPVFKTDDFYPTPQMRTQSLNANIDAQRFLKEILLPLSKGEDVVYKPYLCRTNNFAKEEIKPHNKISVIEGCYCMLPQFRQYYNLTFFADISKEEQQKRLLQREGPAKLEVFNNMWIKKEELYFKTFSLPAQNQQVITLK